MNDGFQCGTYSFNSHTWLIWFIHHLGWQVRNMHEARLNIALLCCIMTHSIHQVIAYKGTGCIRNLCRNAILMQCVNNVFNWQRCKIGTRTIGYNRFIFRLVASIVWNAEVIAVNSNTFHCNIWAPPCLTYT